MSFSISQIAIPNPYFEGPTNAFLIQSKADAPVLVDTGIGTAEALALLRRELAAHGCTLQEIAVVLLTHKHMDHFGLARTIADESGARVYIHADDWHDIVSYDERHTEISALYLDAMHRWGIPEEIVLQLGEVRARFSELARSVPQAEKLSDGQLLRCGALEIRVLHTPGHTKGSACFLLGEKLFTGDHLLPTYTPNVGATDVTSRRLLGRFVSSLQKILALPNAEHLEIWPGHGKPWTNPRPRIEKILRHHQERTERVRTVLGDGRACTAFEIAQKLFGTMKEHHALLGAGEVYAHLEELHAVGRVTALAPNRWKLI